MKPSQYVDAKGVPELKVVLRKWIRVLRKFQAIQDLPWNYRERAQVGFFAGAAWLSGAVALEEWSSTKGLEDKERKGRCDLWIDICDYHIEAKHMWCRITGNLAKEKTYIEKTVESAKECARHLKCSKESKLAFSFLAPFYPPGKQNSLSKDLDAWLSMVCSIEHEAVAWLLPQASELSKQEGQNLGAGILLLISKP